MNAKPASCTDWCLAAIERLRSEWLLDMSEASEIAYALWEGTRPDQRGKTDPAAAADEHMRTLASHPQPIIH